MQAFSQHRPGKQHQPDGHHVDQDRRLARSRIFQCKQSGADEAGALQESVGQDIAQGWKGEGSLL